MNTPIINILLLLSLLIGKTIGFAQHTHTEEESTQTFPSFLFKENKGQWHPNALYKTDLSNGAMFMEKDGITYHFVDRSYLHELHAKKSDTKLPKAIKAHGLKIKFKGANASPTILSKHASTAYENYFIGNDKSKWATNVHAYNSLLYQNIYPNIDFTIYESNGNLKYDFIVKPGANANAIELAYDGAESVALTHGMVYVKTSLNTIIENKPVVYQYLDGVKQFVACNYVLKGTVLSFSFPDGYDTSRELIIDPVLIFSTYSGSTANNFGSTATYDANGNTYAGGMVFGTGYPTTTGAYDISFNNGGSSAYGLAHPDIGISKYNANGGALLYSTYIGGTRAEIPQSLITNAAGELYIFGSTGSANFPTTGSAYSTSFNGGSYVGIAGAAIEHPNGADIFICKLNNTGTSLLASTYIGGNGNDGLINVSGLAMNYGDWFRGEIILDNASNCYVTTSTTSSNFPVTNSTTLGGGTDAIVFKLNASLSTLLWSSYLGGSSDDSGYGIQLDASNNVFVTGGTKSTNLPNASNALQGGVDGYLTKFNPAGVIQTTRYIGTSNYDQSFLVQIDINNEVYVAGQSRGAMPVTAGKYNNPNSGQFIQKFDNNLTTLLYSTVFGRGNNNIDLSLTAFLVNDCGLIYVCGWGGSSNHTNVPTSGTTGLPTTSDAYLKTTTGDDFYLIVLSKDAQSLLYATFFGGNQSSEHVDGGTSRFDKDGNVYQAVCAGCQANSDFPTTAGAWSNTNNSTGCNLAVFKFNVEIVYASASVPQATYCWPDPVNFVNNSSGGNTYLWDFGDGNTSNQYAPSHAYATGGTYTVKLVVTDSTGCILPDSANITIVLNNPVDLQLTPDTSICPGESITLQVAGGTNYLWSPATTLSNATSANPVASPTTNTTYQVVVSNVCSIDTGFVTVSIHPIATSISPDTLVCAGDTVFVSATGGASYLWIPSNLTTNPNAGTTGLHPTTSSNFTVDITTVNGCTTQEDIFVTVDIQLPQPITSADTTICVGQIANLQASGGRSYVWSPSATLSNTTQPNVVAQPNAPTTYYVDVSNACGTVRDSVVVTTQKPTAWVSPPDTICYTDSFLLVASGGTSYSWSPNVNLANPLKDSTIGTPYIPQTYTVIVTDALGCRDTATTRISHYPVPTVFVGNDEVITFGEEVLLQATHSAGTFYWDSSTYISCLTCASTLAHPITTTSFVGIIEDVYGCKAMDTVIIGVDGVIYIPNTFTPDGDGVNDVFFAMGKDITAFEMLIYNRWGQLVFQTKDINQGWDGTYKGEKVKIDTYVWRIRYSDVNTNNATLTGHINVVK